MQTRNSVTTYLFTSWVDWAFFYVISAGLIVLAVSVTVAMLFPNLGSS